MTDKYALYYKYGTAKTTYLLSIHGYAILETLVICSSCFTWKLSEPAGIINGLL